MVTASITRRPRVPTLVYVAFIAFITVATSVTLAVAGDVAADRDARLRCVQLVKSYGSFDVPSAYRAVSEPGGMVVVSRADGTAAHPTDADVERVGFRIETTPTDNFAILPLERLSATHVEGGTVYSRVECVGLNCLFEAAFVPSAAEATAGQCGVGPSYLRVVGVTDRGLVEARRSIKFRWGPADSALPLIQLGRGA